MIRVEKPELPPAILTDEGQRQRTRDEAEYLDHQAAFNAGTRRFEFRRDIYAHGSVRRALAEAQHGKCCFCEAKIQHVSDGDVEHFRPKAAVRQGREDPVLTPGYYWLAYAWSNLYFACQQCNQRNKQSLFPLRDPSARVRSHEEDGELDRERPLFIDPGRDDPERLLGYRDGEPYAIDDDPRARATVIALELGRAHLMERRWERVRMLGVLLGSLQAARDGLDLGDELEDVAALLADWTRADAEFCSLNRNLIRDRLGRAIRMPLTPTELLDFARGRPLPTD